MLNCEKIVSRKKLRSYIIYTEGQTQTEDGQETTAINIFSNQSLSNLNMKQMREKIFINKECGRTSFAGLVDSDHLLTNSTTQYTKKISKGKSINTKNTTNVQAKLKVKLLKKILNTKISSSQLLTATVEVFHLMGMKFVIDGHYSLFML